MNNNIQLKQKINKQQHTYENKNDEQQHTTERKYW